MDIDAVSRKLHVVDVENLIGSGCVRPAEAARCRAAYGALGVLGRHDLIVVGCNPFVGVAVGTCWAPGRLVVRHGTDGADTALTEVLTCEGVERRFTQVVVASGDQLFVDPVVWLQGRGVKVTVVASRRALSKRLRLAAWRVIEFNFAPTPTPLRDVKEAA